MFNEKIIIRITTVPISLDKLIEGQLAFMKDYYEVIAISSGGKTLEDVGEKEGVRVVAIEMTRQITPINDLISVYKLYGFFKKEKPFIVHTHTPKAGTVGMLAAKLAGVPFRLHTIAGLPLLEATGFKRKLLNVVEKITYGCATKLHPNSYGLKEIIIEQKFCKPNKLKVLGNGSSNGIDTTYFSSQNFTAKQNQDLKNSLGICANDFVFIFVGRLVGDKGINELIKAFKKLQNQLYLSKKSEAKQQDSKTARQQDSMTARLLLVGPLETDLDPLLPETLQEIANNKQIISVGWQSDVRPYMAISNCLVFPSYREGFPNVVMQAGAMGLPSIVSNINGCNEIIKEGENGIIIPVKDSVAIFNAMLIMIENKNHFWQLQQNARQMIVSRYEQQLVWDAILKEYKSLGQNV